MLPSVIFSIAYLFCFGDPLHSSISKIARSLIYGTGHMWFLPMLFACFIYTWIIHRLRLKPIIVLLLIFLSSIIFTSAQASLEYSGYYLFFFYLGFSIKVYKFNPMPYTRLRYIFLLAAISVVCFVAVNALNIKEMIPEEVTRSLKVCLLYIYAQLALQFTYSLPGTLAFYLFCLRLLYVKHIAVSPCITKLAGMCFGVYLFQEFIIKGIYYYSPIPQWVGPYALPWVCCMLALPLSMLCTQALLSTRLGRRLIG